MAISLLPSNLLPRWLSAGLQEVSDSAWDLRSMKPEYRISRAGCSGGWPPVGGEGARSLIGSVGGQQGLDCMDLEGTLRNLWDP